MNENSKLFAEIFSAKKDIFNAYVLEYFDQRWQKQQELLNPLVDSVKYSLMQDGKRFRPVLALLLADVFQVPQQKVLPWALAVECIHTYSLIHDDLPCMDNDDFRRGMPTNHKIFGETTALLAGDALLTESFFIIANNYSQQSCLSKLIQLLAQNAGPFGMVGGQILDLNAAQKIQNIEDLCLLHNMKTGALIQAAAEGVCMLANAHLEDFKIISDWSKTLGLAFQVADDLLDQAQKNEESKNFIYFLGVQKTQEKLNQLTQDSIHMLNKLSQSTQFLKDLVAYNLNRQK